MPAASWRVFCWEGTRTHEIPIFRQHDLDGIGHSRVEDVHEVSARGRRLVAKLLNLGLYSVLELCGLRVQALLKGLYPGFHGIETCRGFRAAGLSRGCLGLGRSAFLLTVRLAGASILASAAVSCLMVAGSAAAAAGFSSLTGAGDGVSTDGSPEFLAYAAVVAGMGFGGRYSMSGTCGTLAWENASADLNGCV